MQPQTASCAPKGSTRLLWEPACVWTAGAASTSTQRATMQRAIVSCVARVLLILFEIGALLDLESVSLAENAHLVNTGSTAGAFRVPRGAVGRVSRANTRQPRGQLHATHASLLQRVRPGHTASTVAEALKGPAQVAESVLLVNIASSASLSRRDAAPPACQARTRAARDLSPV